MSAHTDGDWTSIPVHSSTRDKVSALKRDDEIWTETIERLLDGHSPQGND
jgi:uncharacterized protein (UPF0297 family)